MTPVEDTTERKRCPNFLNWELVAMISMVWDNKILLLGKLDNVNSKKEGNGLLAMTTFVPIVDA